MLCVRLFFYLFEEQILGRIFVISITDHMIGSSLMGSFVVIMQLFTADFAVWISGHMTLLFSFTVIGTFSIASR